MRRDSNARVAGTTGVAFLKEYFEETETFNLGSFFRMQASELVDDPMEADIVVSDRTLTLPDGTEQIHSYDFSRILALMNS